MVERTANRWVGEPAGNLHPIQLSDQSFTPLSEVSRSRPKTAGTADSRRAAYRPVPTWLARAHRLLERRQPGSCSLPDGPIPKPQIPFPVGGPSASSRSRRGRAVTGVWR